MPVSTRSTTKMHLNNESPHKSDPDLHNTLRSISGRELDEITGYGHPREPASRDAEGNTPNNSRLSRPVTSSDADDESKGREVNNNFKPSSPKGDATPSVPTPPYALEGQHTSHTNDFVGSSNNYSNNNFIHKSSGSPRSYTSIPRSQSHGMGENILNNNYSSNNNSHERHTLEVKTERAQQPRQHPPINSFNQHIMGPPVGATPGFHGYYHTQHHGNFHANQPLVLYQGQYYPIAPFAQQPPQFGLPYGDPRSYYNYNCGPTYHSHHSYQHPPLHHVVPPRSVAGSTQYSHHSIPSPPLYHATPVPYMIGSSYPSSVYSNNTSHPRVPNRGGNGSGGGNGPYDDDNNSSDNTNIHISVRKESSTTRVTSKALDTSKKTWTQATLSKIKEEDTDSRGPPAALHAKVPTETPNSKYNNNTSRNSGNGDTSCDRRGVTDHILDDCYFDRDDIRCIPCDKEGTTLQAYRSKRAKDHKNSNDKPATEMFAGANSADLSLPSLVMAVKTPALASTATQPNTGSITFILDSRATIHCTGMPALGRHLSGSPSSSQLKLANGVTLPIQGEGNLTATTADGAQVVIPSVHYVEGLKHNILSLLQLAQSLQARICMTSEHGSLTTSTGVELPFFNNNGQYFITLTINALVPSAPSSLTADEARGVVPSPSIGNGLPDRGVTFNADTTGPTRSQAQHTVMPADIKITEPMMDNLLNANNDNCNFDNDAATGRQDAHAVPSLVTPAPLDLAASTAASTSTETATSESPQAATQEPNKCGCQAFDTDHAAAEPASSSGSTTTFLDSIPSVCFKCPAPTSDAVACTRSQDNSDDQEWIKALVASFAITSNISRHTSNTTAVQDTNWEAATLLQISHSALLPDKPILEAPLDSPPPPPDLVVSC
jgi:hypothetical protein